MTDPASAEFRRRQLTLLLERHRHEDVILARVLTEHYQHVASEAKAGRGEGARAQLKMLAEEVPLPDTPELRGVVELAALPAWALVDFQEGNLDAARQLLLRALEVAAELAACYGHDFLTGKRLHLAANVVRIEIADGQQERAAALLVNLRAVSLGNRNRWPFVGATTLDVPLSPDVRLVIDSQLGREQDRLMAGRR